MAGKKKGDLQHDNTRNEPLTDDELQALTLHHKKQYESAMASKKKAASALLTVTKLIKAELGSDGLLDIKDMLASETEDDFEEKIQAELERKARLARWLSLNVGAQASLFDVGTTKASMVERAGAEGKRAGLAGELLKPPYDGGTEAYHAYVKEWHAGQAANLSLIKKKDADEVPLIVKADREESTVDEFDDAASGDDFGEDDGEDAPWPDEVAAAATDEPAAEREPAEAL